MNWLKNFVRPRFPSVFRDHDDTPDNLWQSCKQCGEMIFHRDLALLQQVCPGCDHHMRVGARERFAPGAARPPRASRRQGRQHARVQLAEYGSTARAPARARPARTTPTTSTTVHARNLRLRRLPSGYASVLVSCIVFSYYKCILHSVFCIHYTYIPAICARSSSRHAAAVRAVEPGTAAFGFIV